MINVLYEQLPDYVTVDGKRYRVVTDFREWIRFSALIDDDTVPYLMKIKLILEWYENDCPEDIEAAVYALGNFLSAKEIFQTYESGESAKATAPAFSFSEDANYIYSA